MEKAGIGILERGLDMNKSSLLNKLEKFESEVALYDLDSREVMEKVISMVNELEEQVDSGYTKKVLKLNEKSYLKIVHFGDEGRFNALTNNPFHATDVSMAVGDIGSIGGKIVEFRLTEK